VLEHRGEIPWRCSITMGDINLDSYNPYKKCESISVSNGRKIDDQTLVDVT